MSCNSIVCSVFEVDFEMAVIGIKVPSSLLERGIRKGMVTVDFGDIIGPPLTAESWEPAPQHTTGDKTAEALPKGDITPHCGTCVYDCTGNLACTTCNNFCNHTPA